MACYLHRIMDWMKGRSHLRILSIFLLSQTWNVRISCFMFFFQDPRIGWRRWVNWSLWRNPVRRTRFGRIISRWSSCSSWKQWGTTMWVAWKCAVVIISVLTRLIDTILLQFAAVFYDHKFCFNAFTSCFYRVSKFTYIYISSVTSLLDVLLYIVYLRLYSLIFQKTGWNHCFIAPTWWHLHLLSYDWDHVKWRDCRAVLLHLWFCICDWYGLKLWFLVLGLN